MLVDNAPVTISDTGELAAETDVDSLEAVLEKAANRGQARPEAAAPHGYDDDDIVLPGEFLGSELVIEVIPRQHDEFVCGGCFLVRHRAQRVTSGIDLCRDCD